MALNELHTFLSAGNVQARPVIGSTITLGNQANLPCFLSQIDEKTAFELGGTMAEMDRVCVIDRSVVTAGSPPEINQTVTVEGTAMIIKAIRSDQSAYTLGLSMIDAEADVEGPE